MKKSQADRILNYLQKGNKLTPLKALKLFSCLRLGGRIYDLKQQGHNIISTMVTRNGRRVAEYRLAE